MSRQFSVRFLHVPEYWCGGAVEHTANLPAPDCGCGPLPERNVDHLVVNARLDLGRDLLLLLQGLRSRKGVTQFFHAGVLGPAEPGALRTFAVDWKVGNRVRDILSHQVGKEHVPAALL